MLNKITNSIIDISTPLKEGVPVWPGSTGVNISWTLRVEKGEQSNLTRLDADIHIGTHVEGSLHSFSDGSSIDQIPLDKLIGPATVIDITDIDIITEEVLESTHLLEGTKRLLFHTRNSDRREAGQRNFQEDFVGLTASGAQWIVNHGVGLVGIDYLSVACYTESSQVHEILLKNEVVIVEGLNLADVEKGEYQFICLPILLPGREAAPARAILIPVDND